MKNKIYYFSGTGNTLALVKKLSDVVNDFELINIFQLDYKNKRIKIEGDRVGFVFPVYFANTPENIIEFLKQVDFGSVNYVFALMNGGGLFGTGLKTLRKILKKKGVKINAGFTVKMPGNHPKIQELLKHTPEEYYKIADEKMKLVTRKVKNKENHKIETNWGIAGVFFTRIIFKKLQGATARHEFGARFIVDETCTNCEICEKSCPAGNIVNSGTKVEYLDRCLSCLRCYSICPEKSITIDGVKDPEERYIHPDFNINENIFKHII